MFPSKIVVPFKKWVGKSQSSYIEKSKKNLVDSLKVNQWKDTDSVINGFNATKDKSQCCFIKLHIVEFYPSITIGILDTAISLVRQHTDTTDENIGKSKRCRASLLYKKQEP